MKICHSKTQQHTIHSIFIFYIICMIDNYVSECVVFCKEITHSMIVNPEWEQNKIVIDFADTMNSKYETKDTLAFCVLLCTLYLKSLWYDNEAHSIRST